MDRLVKFLKTNINKNSLKELCNQFGFTHEQHFNNIEKQVIKLQKCSKTELLNKLNKVLSHLNDREISRDPASRDSYIVLFAIIILSLIRSTTSANKEMDFANDSYKFIDNLTSGRITGKDLSNISTFKKVVYEEDLDIDYKSLYNELKKNIPNLDNMIVLNDYDSDAGEGLVTKIVESSYYQNNYPDENFKRIATFGKYPQFVIVKGSGNDGNDYYRLAIPRSYWSIDFYPKEILSKIKDK